VKVLILIRDSKIVWLAFVTICVLFIGLSYAEGPVTPKPKDKCPVCGMFVEPYPQWTAEILFADGSYAVFDGAKDMFKYYFNVPKYNKGKTVKDITGIYVTDYYTTEKINAKDVYFVTGSSVMGPMGSEMVPIKGKREAETFMRDHQGKKMFRFEDVTPGDIPH
jgi:nitrous oxide reductase accessory protein NosL